MPKTPTPGNAPAVRWFRSNGRPTRRAIGNFVPSSRALTRLGGRYLGVGKTTMWKLIARVESSKRLLAPDADF